MTSNDNKWDIEIYLRRASDDPPVRDEAFQRELVVFAKGLRSGGIPYSQRAMAFDSAAALGYPLAEFIIKELGPPAFTLLAALAGHWVAARNGRKVRLKVGDIEAEAGTAEEVLVLLERAHDLRARPNAGNAPEGDNSL